MIEEKNKHQQQILFDEIDTDTTNQDLPATTAQVEFDNADWQENDTDELVEDKEYIVKKPAWLWRIIGSLLLVIVLVETVDFFIAGFEQSPIIAAIYAALLGCLMLVAGSSLVKEFFALRQYKNIESYRTKVAQLTESTNSDDAEILCREISASLPCDLTHDVDLFWQKVAQSEYTQPELIQLYSREVIEKVDQKALAEVAKFSTEAVVLVGLSPIAFVDMLLMLWRNLRMIDKIAGLYGLKLSYWTRIKLIKQVFINMAYAGASELVADLGADLMGAELLGKLSGKMAQGLGAGMLTARLGLKAITLCRPIPFEHQQPKLNAVRKQIASQVKDLLLKNKK